MGAKLFIGTLLDAKRRYPKLFWYGLCENTWFPWQPIADLRIGLYLQNYSYLSCFLSYTTKLNTKLNLRHIPIIPLCVAYANYLICKFINIHESIKMGFTDGRIFTVSITSPLLLAIDY